MTKYILIKTEEEICVLITNDNEEMLVTQYVNNMKKRYNLNQILSEVTSIYDAKYVKIKNVIEMKK